MGVHGDDGREVLELQVPHRLGGAEFLQRHPVHPLDAAGVELRRSADPVEVDRAVLLQPGQGLGTHSALADHRADAVAADDVGLVGLLADAGGRSGRGDRPGAVVELLHHRTAVVDQAASQIDRRLVRSSDGGARRRGR